MLIKATESRALMNTWQLFICQLAARLCGSFSTECSTLVPMCVIGATPNPFFNSTTATQLRGKLSQQVRTFLPVKYCMSPAE